MIAEIASIVGSEHVAADVEVVESSGLRGTAAALAQPSDAQQVATLVRWCYEHDVAMVPIGGRSGLAGGTVPGADALAIDLGRLSRIRSFDPLHWRIEAEAGVKTAVVAGRAREAGLMFGPDPGAAEESTLGGNLACNAGGPHTFKYGSMSAWTTGIEVVIAPGELVTFGGPVRKDVAGYDLRSLMIGSEGTLGIITAAWLRLAPAPPVEIPLVGTYSSLDEGVQAIENVLSSGVVPATLEYLDAATLRVAGDGYPGVLGDRAALMIIAEAESEEDAKQLADALSARTWRPDPGELWRWRKSVNRRVTATQGAKLSEDIVVPVDRLAEAIDAILQIGARNGYDTCSWGHAGDGNLHATFMHPPGEPPPEPVVQEVFDLALELGGTVSGEHGLGLLKNNQLSKQWSPAAIAAQEAVKLALDPKGLFNPGKKLP